MAKRRLWTPRSARPRWVCRICQKPFFDEEQRAYIAHCVSCANEHHDQLVAEQTRRRPPKFFKPWDPEFAEWAKKSVQGRG